MGQEYKLVPFKEQDKLLKDSLLKTDGGSYIRLDTASYWIGGKEMRVREMRDRFNGTPSTQDRLGEGLMRFPNGSYHPIDSIEKVGEHDCFVATTVYGDGNAPQVEALRQFRDEVLMRSRLGGAFVGFYYSGAGRNTANFIENHLPFAIPAIRRGLDALVEKYSAQKR